MTLGQQIARLRKERNMTQDDLAEAMFVSRQAISKWETGTANPDTENLIRLAEVFQIDVNALICNETENSTPEKPGAHSRAVIAVLSFFLVAAVALAAVFACLWLRGENGSLFSDAQEVDWLDTVVVQWQMTSREVELTKTEKLCLLNYLDHYPLEKLSATEVDDDTDGPSSTDLCGPGSHTAGMGSTTFGN